jgi:hypothetical protein
VGAFGLDLERASGSYGGRLLLSSGHEARHGLRTDDTFAGVRLHAATVGDVGPLTWSAGPSLGVLYWRQQSQGHALQTSLTGLMCLRGALTAPLTGRLQLALTADVGLQAVRSDDPVPRLGAKVSGIALLPWAGYTLEAHLLF